MKDEERNEQEIRISNRFITPTSSSFSIIEENLHIKGLSPASLCKKIAMMTTATTTTLTGNKSQPTLTPIFRLHPAFKRAGGNRAERKQIERLIAGLLEQREVTTSQLD